MCIRMLFRLSAASESSNVWPLKFWGFSEGTVNQPMRPQYGLKYYHENVEYNQPKTRGCQDGSENMLANGPKAINHVGTDPAYISDKLDHHCECRSLSKMFMWLAMYNS